MNTPTTESFFRLTPADITSSKGITNDMKMCQDYAHNHIPVIQRCHTIYDAPKRNRQTKCLDIIDNKKVVTWRRQNWTLIAVIHSDRQEPIKDIIQEIYWNIFINKNVK